MKYERRISWSGHKKQYIQGGLPYEKVGDACRTP